MDVGDRVIYVGSGEVHAGRDFGTVLSLPDDYHDIVVLFDDGLETECFLDDLVVYKEIKVERKEEPLHLHFGCIDADCPDPGHSPGFTTT